MSDSPALLLTRCETSYPIALHLSLPFCVMGMITAPLPSFSVSNNIITIKSIWSSICHVVDTQVTSSFQFCFCQDWYLRGTSSGQGL